MMSCEWDRLNWRAPPCSRALQLGFSVGSKLKGDNLRRKDLLPLLKVIPKRPYGGVPDMDFITAQRRHER